MKFSEIVKPSDINSFLHLQTTCLSEDMRKIQFLARIDYQLSYKKTGDAESKTVELIALYEITQTPVIEISFCITEQSQQLLDLFLQTVSGKEIASELKLAWVELKKGLPLEPVCIPKPWGQEIWYTGIEERGVSRVTSEEGSSPLDWVLSAAPKKILGDSTTPILLKTLDPLPDEVYGDLYVEMHEKKQEVYVVTQVDNKAWPDGKGEIRFGFNQKVRKTFASDDEFKEAYLQAVQNYQQVRKEIDSLLDKKCTELKLESNSPGSPVQLEAWKKEFSPELIEQEKGLREKMDDFLVVKPLVVGDVVKVPCYTPHSLQHGVRTVEFQTPVYERKILSFAQKVLTQKNWDTESALEQVSLEAPEDAPLELLSDEKGLRREQVVQFDDFEVERITLQAGTRFQNTNKTYALLLVVSGDLQLKKHRLKAEQACLLPVQTALDASSENGTVFLLAKPCV